MTPTIFIVPGIYEGPAAFGPLAAALRDRGYEETTTTALVSTGWEPASGTPAPTMDDDVAAVAADLARAVERAGDAGVVALMHSAGGMLGSAAMRGLSAPACARDGKRGGVHKIVFFTAGIAPEGTEHHPPPFFEFLDDGKIQRCRDPLHNFFADFPPEKAQEWLGRMSHQPGKGWDKTITYCGWREVPSVYIIAEDDNLLPATLQEQFADRAGSKVVRLKGGHMAQLIKTEELAAIVDDAAQGRI